MVLDMAQVGEIGGRPDGGADGREPLVSKEVIHREARGLNVHAARNGTRHLGKFHRGFALGGEPRVKFLPTLKAVFQWTLAFGAAFKPTVLGPVAFATGGAALQRLQTEVDGELPGGSLLQVAAHNSPSPFPRDRPVVHVITAPKARKSKDDGLEYCALLCSKLGVLATHPVLHLIMRRFGRDGCDINGQLQGFLSGRRITTVPYRTIFRPTTVLFWR
jgi:hypothetical protein